jgi:hypothetical protein
MMERLDFDLSFRWFVGIGIDEPVWDASTFSKNRERLLDGELAACFLSSILARPQVKRLLSNDHFSVDGTLIEAWCSMKSFRPKEEAGADGPTPDGRDGADRGHAWLGFALVRLREVECDGLIDGGRSWQRSLLEMSGPHRRDTETMHQSPRCGAKTRQGQPCQAPAVGGSARCRMHGGKGSGAPKGNRNALKSGLYTGEALDLRRHVSRVLRDGRKAIKDITE